MSTTRIGCRAPSSTSGVRYDHSRATFPSLPFLNAQGLPTGQMSQANDDVYAWDTFSPRVGVNYQVTSSGNTVVKAHYGRYYKALEPTEYRGAVPSIAPAYSFTQDAAGNRSNFVQTSSNTNLQIDPNFKSAYNDQFMVQLEQQIIRDLGLQVNYVHKEGADYGAWQDITGQYLQVPYVDNVGIDATGETVMVYKLVSDRGRSSLRADEPGRDVHEIQRRRRSPPRSACRTTGRRSTPSCSRRPKGESARAPAPPPRRRRPARPERSDGTLPARMTTSIPTACWSVTARW